LAGDKIAELQGNGSATVDDLVIAVEPALSAPGH
jgi:hypothetical protein